MNKSPNASTTPATPHGPCRYIGVGCRKTGYVETSGLCADHFLDLSIEPLEQKLRDYSRFWLMACTAEHYSKPVWACDCGLTHMTFTQREQHFTKNKDHQPARSARTRSNGPQQKQKRPTFIDDDEVVV